MSVRKDYSSASRCSKRLRSIRGRIESTEDEVPPQDPDQSTENDEYPAETAEDDVPQNETESVKTEGSSDQDQDHSHSETDPDRQLIDEMANDNQDVQGELQRLRDEVARLQAR
ncbi:hypothetical protein DL770_010969 [Monosporascus sp. CRB-9-2]|nr:hypothetical protein DL770_010969 [Monosporascus sp. CRB-9-2]